MNNEKVHCNMSNKQINFDGHTSRSSKNLTTTRVFVGTSKAGMAFGIANQTCFETPTSICFTPLLTNTIVSYEWSWN